MSVKILNTTAGTINADVCSGGSAGSKQTRLEFDELKRCDIFKIAIRKADELSSGEKRKFWKWTPLQLDGETIYVNVSSASKRLNLSIWEVYQKCSNGTLLEWVKSNGGDLHRWASAVPADEFSLGK